MKKVILFSALALSAVMLAGCAGKENTSQPESKVQSANTSGESNPARTEYSEDLQKTDDWTFRYNKDLGGIIIEKCLCAPRSTDDRVYDSEKEITIPDSFEGFEGLKVLEIGKSAFSDVVCKSVTLPDGLIYIDESAFSGAEIAETLTIPQTVKEIRKSAFKQIKCPTVELPPVEVIAESLFEEAEITSIVIPETVTEIQDNAFFYCGITSITLSEGMEIVPGGIHNCHNLTEVKIPSSVKEIGDFAFGSCGITSITLNEGLEIIGDRAFNNCENLTQIEIPSTVKEIKDYAFLNCSNVKSVTLNEGLETIGAGAFAGLDASEYVLPDSIKSVVWTSDYDAPERLSIGQQSTFYGKTTKSITEKYYTEEHGHGVTITYKGVQYEAVDGGQDGSGFQSTALPQAIKDNQ